LDPGPAEDFDHFVARRRGHWLRVATAILRNPADAEDVVQDTLLSVWRLWQNSSLRNPDGYVSRAVTINALRRRSRRRPIAPLDSIAEPIAPATFPAPIDPLELERAIANLPQTQQVVLRTKYYLGLTFNQIGKNLSISSNTAASRARYALASLRRTFGLSNNTISRKEK
jgi:RNA polymerase sigma-70 factor (ECF subfamily)